MYTCTVGTCRLSVNLCSVACSALMKFSAQHCTQPSDDDTSAMTRFFVIRFRSEAFCNINPVFEEWQFNKETASLSFISQRSECVQSYKHNCHLKRRYCVEGFGKQYDSLCTHPTRPCTEY